jgi:alpha-L-rhamnosidase
MSDNGWSVTVSDVRAEYVPGCALGIGAAAPRLSWITTTERAGWMQSGYEIELDGVALGRVEGDASVFVPWPGPPLTSRAAHRVRVRVWGADGSESTWSEPLDLEAGLLSPDDWSARWITSADSGSDDPSGRPEHFRHEFTLHRPGGVTIERARLYATSAGINQLQLNGQVVGDTLLAPGWSMYDQRLRYETHDVTALVAPGENAIGAVVADGWWRGHLSWEMRRNVYGDRIGLLAQLEITYSDGTVETIATDATWQTSLGPILTADLYNGESFDARVRLDGWSTAGFDDSAWSDAETFTPKVGRLVARAGPPVRRTQELTVREILVTPSGRTVLDFGQNLVGWVRFTVEGAAGTVVTLRHAEVLEHGELGTRPLRNAEATDRYTLRGDGPEAWEPTFTFHGFRYAEVDGWPDAEVDPRAFTAVVMHSDFERTGTFSCSNEMLERLHENVVWGMRGNFVDVPTDCPQRDERLGWTGDLQVFAPSATFLFDVAGFLADWLDDLRAEQRGDGAVPLVVPAAALEGLLGHEFVAAAWGDVATVLPWTLYERYGDTELLARQLDSMRGWVDFVRAKAGNELLWPREFQFGDWLDPDAPPDEPARAKTSAVLVATAYFAHSAQLVSDAAAVLGREDLAREYGDLARAIREAFRDEYVTPSGLLSSDSVTAYSLAIVFNLYEDAQHRARAATRIAELAADRSYRISTGFVGTPLVLPALSAAGDTKTAYRLLTETACPSWLYPVTMGATTIWERWDAMLPDGSINPGEMTSFNHYALGGVADWMHRTIGGIAPDAPGYKRLRFAPVPGRGVVRGSSTLRTPYGAAGCAWSLEGTDITLEVEVPPNTSATVVRPGQDEEPLTVLAGKHRWTYAVADAIAAAWADPPDG